MAGSKSISPDSCHLPPGFAGEQVLAHDLGVQQDRRAGWERDGVEERGYLVCPQCWQAQRSLRAGAMFALARYEGRPVGGPPVVDCWRRKLVQRCDGLAQLACQPVAVLRGYLVPDGIQRDSGQAAHQYVTPPVVRAGRVDPWSRRRQLPCYGGQHLRLDPVIRPGGDRREELEDQVAGRVDGSRASLVPGQAICADAQEPAQLLDSGPERSLILADRRERFLGRCRRQYGHGTRP
jgi:hypothetical protein